MVRRVGRSETVHSKISPTNGFQPLSQPESHWSQSHATTLDSVCGVASDSQNVRSWTQQCVSCQASKAHCHVKAPLQPFPSPRCRFQPVHVDILGPWLLSRGHRYLLTCIDCFTRRTTATPMPDISAEFIASAFLSGWVSHFDAPNTVITDRGAHFESHLWQDLMSFLDTAHNQTTAYHPQANGIVEHFHRHLHLNLTHTVGLTFYRL